ncbi:MAG TPA: peptidylprolyl isomerase, partial [Polyangiaceae bacterium]|nr:peptidylprolyl isomerase [Polyangiaceae bacterium]
EHSEDIVTRESGGSLGGVPATQLLPWPEVLDALTALVPGEVSNVVETWYGFHVLLRRAAPEPDLVTGRRLVIGHDQARFLRALRGGSQPTRSREEAFALAQRLYERARTAPGEFPELVATYSELPDRVLGGDFGTWSNRELTPFPREVEALTQLAVGEVAPPLDSLFGIEVVMRVANPERASYALDGLQLSFDLEAPEGDPQSSANVQAEALRLNEALRRDPSQLDLLSQRYAPYREHWVEGRGLPEVTAAVREVSVGEVLRVPARVGTSIVIGRRIAAHAPEPVAALSELPLGNGSRGHLGP